MKLKNSYFFTLREDVKDWLLETLTSRDIDNPYEWYKDICIK